MVCADPSLDVRRGPAELLIIPPLPLCMLFSFYLPVFYSRLSSFLCYSPGPDGQQVLLVTIPEFVTTQTACLVNLRTLECEPMSFSSFSPADEEEDSEMNVSH